MSPFCLLLLDLVIYFANVWNETEADNTHERREVSKSSLRPFFHGAIQLEITLPVFHIGTEVVLQPNIDIVFGELNLPSFSSTASVSYTVPITIATTLGMFLTVIGAVLNKIYVFSMKYHTEH